MRLAIIVGLAVLGAMVWVGSLFAVGQYAEDLCFDDLDEVPGRGAYRTHSVLWPPSYECRLLGGDVDPLVVQHRGVAIARFAAVVVVPVVYAISATALFVLWNRRRRGGLQPTATDP